MINSGSPRERTQSSFTSNLLFNNDNFSAGYLGWLGLGQQLQHTPHHREVVGLNPAGCSAFFYYLPKSVMRPKSGLLWRYNTTDFQIKNLLSRAVWGKASLIIMDWEKKLQTSINNPLKFFSDMLGIEPGAAEWEASSVGGLCLPKLYLYLLPILCAVPGKTA